MSKKATIHKTLTWLIASVWLINGLLCKVLNFVPRHQQIVARILGDEHTTLFTKAIGLSEILMAVWVLSSFKSKFCAIIQMVIVSAMNIIEFFLASDLLLFGKINLLMALVFIVLIYLNEFVLNKKSTQQI